MTLEGNIIVDGVLASCYASVDHDLAHIGMTPLRWFPKLVELLFGREDEKPVYVNLNEEFGRWLLTHIYSKLYETTY